MLRTKAIPNKWKYAFIPPQLLCFLTHCRNELMRMIYIRRKAEIEIIITMPRISELGESAPLGNFYVCCAEERGH
jgi:hypothetical protein